MWFKNILTLVIVGVFTILVFCIEIAIARDLEGKYAQSPLKPWFNHLASKKGLCCSEADGQTVIDADWETKDGHYRVFIEGQWWIVPDDAVITEPNLDGRTIVWPIFYRSFDHLDRVEIRCFIPGVMG